MKSRGPDDVTVQLVFEREGGRCVRCGVGLLGERGWDWSIHHRRGRDGKPDSHMPQNLLAVCGGDNVSGCHGYIHQRRSDSEPRGWWLSRIAGTDPLTRPALVQQQSRWVYLTADGEYANDPPEAS